MPRLTRRKQPIPEHILDYFESPRKSTIWEAYGPGFEAVFREPYGIDEDRRGADAEKMYSRHVAPLDWSWYETKRLRTEGITGSHFSESLLFNALYGEFPQRLVYFHGHTGVGKSTLLRYFFSHYVPNHANWDEGRLDRFVPVKIPLAFYDPRELEHEWDDRVFMFLYNEFEELTQEPFIRNVARHLAYPVESSKRELILSDSGELVPEGFRPGFVRDTENRINSTFVGIDRKSVVDWLRTKIAVIEDLPLGVLFNRSVIQVLARYYGYEFVFAVDNIDDLPSDIQSEICRLVSIKMRAYTPYPTVKFIISTRDNFLEPILSETFPVAQRFHHMMLDLPPLPFGLVLSRRKTSFFDPLMDKASKTIELSGGVTVRVEHIDTFIDAVFSVFDNVKPITDLHQLSNHSTRRMLDIVRSVFESPHIEVGLVADIARASTREPKVDVGDLATKFISINRIVDSLVRGTNRLVARKEKATLPNIYFSGFGRHYSSTLCRIFILSIVVTDEEISYEDLEKHLLALDHPPDTITAAVANLLQMRLVFSSQGFQLRKDRVERKLQMLERRELPFGEYLLDHLGVSLRYLQGMAFVTPMEAEFRKQVVVPEELGGEVEEFRSRILAASALYRQIDADLSAQLMFIRQAGEGAERLARLMDRYGLRDIADNIHDAIRSELHAIGRRSPTLLTGINISDLFPAPTG